MQRQQESLSLKSVFLLVCLVIQLVGFSPLVEEAPASIFSYSEQAEKKETVPQASTNSQTDVQDDEYGESTKDTTTLTTEIPGVGAMLGKMLDSLTSVTQMSEGRLKTILEAMPMVFPDLYKVFITL